jgi:hypothetical protein
MEFFGCFVALLAYSWWGMCVCRLVLRTFTVGLYGYELQFDLACDVSLDHVPRQLFSSISY